ncbi:hypothetical protein [Nocardia xishanensis]|uniref:hypothetical protein n=1 Tax=Nocardia xishanensis TaxID=238964 RepID=UPI0033E1F27B
MFRTLATLLIPDGSPSVQAEAVFAFHPEQLSRWLDEMWAEGGISTWVPIFTDPVDSLGDVKAITSTQIPGRMIELFQSGVSGTAPGYAPPAVGTSEQVFLWDHLFYAYLIESTGAFEIFAEVVRRYVVGETLPAPRVATIAWARATEELFFRDPPLFRVGGLTSQLRPDARVNRRNAYWRMFGLDLPHAAAGVSGQPWKQDAGATGTIRFIEIWNELLRQVWLGIENERNSSGANPTDSTYIAFLCQTLGEMLRMRRIGGMLSRDEFSFVSVLSWFHLTVGSDNTVIQDLSAKSGSGGNAADRLAAVGARVGVAPSRQARELFELADVISPLLWAIELRMFDSAPQAELLYRSTGISNPAPAQTMNRIIDLWQSATGDRVKDLAVTTRRQWNQLAGSAQPAKLLPTATLSSAPVPAPSANGQRTAVSRH